MMAKDANKTALEPELETSDELEELLEWPTSQKNKKNRRKTLCNHAEDEDGPEPTKAKFQDMLKDPDALYEDIIELLRKIREIREYRDNYREQLHEARQAIRRNEVVLDRVITREGTPSGSLQPENARRTTKLPDPPLFDGSCKDGTTYDNWLIQVKNKLRGNADAYPTEDLRIIYAAG